MDLRLARLTGAGVWGVFLSFYADSVRANLLFRINKINVQHNVACLLLTFSGDSPS